MTPMNTHRDTEDLQDAPLLRSLAKHDPFVVPDGFYDRFPAEVKQRIALPEPRTAWTERLGVRWMDWRMASLAGALGVAMVIMFLRPGTGSDVSNDLTITSSAALPEEAYLERIDDQDLWALYGEDPELLTTVGDGFEDHELEAFILHQELPVELLIEEL
jgi:hypothetical protein